MAKRVVWMFAVAAISLVGQQAHAQDFFTKGVRPTGMGMAFTGVATGTGGLFHNPAGIASRMMYAIDGTYEYTPNGSVLNAAVVDSKTNPDVSAGVAYSYFFGRDDFATSSGHSARLALAFPVLPERVSVGVGGRYLNTTVDEVQVMNGVTIDAGALFQATDLIQVGLAGQNLIDLCDDPSCHLVAPTLISGGAAVGDESTILVSADGGVDLTSDPEAVHPFFEAGAEYFAGGTVPLRLGFQHLGATSQQLITAGAGVRMQTAGVDFGFRMDLDEPQTFWANGSVSIYF